MFEIERTEVQDNEIVRALFSGEFRRELVFEFIDTMTEYEEKYPGHNLLVDFTGVSEVAIGLDDMRSIVSYMKENDKRQGKTAFVTGDNIGRFNLAKYFVDLVSFFRQNRQKAFKFEEPAIHWLYQS